MTENTIAFNATLETDKVAQISLSGELNAASAAIFKKQVETAAEAKPSRLFLFMQDLKYMASAGLRVLIFAKQKMGHNVDIYVVDPQEMVLDTLEKTGFAQSVIIVKKYEPAPVTA